MPRSSRTCFMCKSKQFLRTRADCSFHKFPSDQSTLSKWLEFCNLTIADNVSGLFICSKHFSPDQFYRQTTKDQSYKLNLKKGATPTIKKPGARSKSFLNQDVTNITKPAQSVENVQLVADTSASTMSLSFCPEDENEKPSIYTPSNDIDPLEDTSTSTISCFSEAENQKPVTYTAVDSLEDPSTLRRRRFNEPRYIGDIKTSDLETPTGAKRSLQIAKEVVAKQAKKIRALQKSNRLMKKRIRSLVDLVNQLKKKDFISQDSILL